jgi:PAS domain S-box-containing protein
LAAVLLVLSLPGLSQDARDPLSPEERAWLQAHGPLRYAPHVEAPPFEFLRADGQVAGIVPELLAILARNLRVEIKPVRFATWAEALEGVRRGEADFLGLIRPTPERERAEEALRRRVELQDQLAKIAATVPGVICSLRLRPDGSLCMPYASPALEEILGLKPADVAEDFSPAFARIHPDDVGRAHSSIAESARTMLPWWDEFRVRHPRKGELWAEGRSVPRREPDGSILWHGFVQDITERKQAEETRLRLEAQLRQAQKMEAVGQLAGGVAHDFNNLLTVIVGNAGLLADEPALTPNMQEPVRQIATAAQRAADLSRQLLTFSRRQAMQIRSLNLDEVLSNISKMLHRLLGEQIALQCNYAPNLPPIEADAGMLEQVVVNLAVNARDAMPKGGRLVLSTQTEVLGPEVARTNSQARTGQRASPPVQPGPGPRHRNHPARRRRSLGASARADLPVPRRLPRAGSPQWRGGASRVAGTRRPGGPAAHGHGYARRDERSRPGRAVAAGQA